MVATPIGNREDITLRALRVLREVALVAAEDTRHTGQLLAHHGIHARYLSLHEHNERQRAEAIVARLASGDAIALVSDAGTPLLADPGARLVAAVREAGFPVVAVPGPSALLAAISVTDIVDGPFTFVGFLPPKQAARRSALAALRELPHPLVCYEAPHRLPAMLDDAREVLGDRQCALCRELTKLHEEIIEGRFSALHETLSDRPPRGEYVVVIAASDVAPPAADEAAIDAMLRELLAAGQTPAAAAKATAGELGVDRGACYRRAIAIRQALKAP